MDDTKRLDLSLKTLAATVLLGLIGNLLLRDAPWGIGFGVYALTIVGMAGYLNRSSSVRITRDVQWLAAIGLLFASAFAWRDATALKILNGVAVALIVGLVALRARTGNLTVASVFDYPFRLFERWFAFVGDFVPLVMLEGRWAKIGARKRHLLRAILRGTLLSLPLMLLFGGLFVSADATFERLVVNAFSFDLEAVASNVLVTLACAWLVGGFFRHLFLAVEPPPTSIELPKPTLGITEIGIVLGALNLLFAAFVAVQFRHFFGGAEVVRTTAGLGYADYARRAFFELVTVAGLALPVLLGTHALLRREGAARTAIFNFLATTLVVLLFVVLASATQRMAMYVQVYGISQLRIYVIAILAWLAGVFVWFCATVLRGRAPRFAFGALAMLLVGIFALDAANPDAIVANVNTSRVADNLDTNYLLNLSADAVPSLVEALPTASPPVRDALTKGLQRKQVEIRRTGWRSWNYSTEAARRALRSAGF